MRAIVIRAYGPYRRGVEINPPDGLGNLLIRRGFLRAIEEVAAKPVATAPNPVPVEPPKPNRQRR
jgi:hypothetical protein